MKILEKNHPENNLKKEIFGKDLEFFLLKKWKKKLSKSKNIV